LRVGRVEIANPAESSTDDPTTAGAMDVHVESADVVFPRRPNVDVPLWEAAAPVSHSIPSGLMGNGEVSSSTAPPV
jgi:hypothetical protein